MRGRRTETAQIKKRPFMLWQTFHTAYALRPKTERDKTDLPASEIETDIEPDDDDLWIVCRQCRQRLTRPSERISFNGSHTHTFANPSGVVFEIGCFRMASRISLIGPPSYEFPWFASHSWQIAICATCQSHLGWHFKGQGGTQFFGLILDQLKEIASPE